MIEGTETLPVGSLVSRPMPFFVHIYQRAYAWELEEVDDFIGDLKLLYENRENESNGSIDHFFGGIVLIRRSENNTPVGMSYEVVDGQQRLATFMITLNLISKALASLSAEAQQESDLDTYNDAQAHAELTQSQYLFYQHVESGQIRQKPRLTLSRADRIFFNNLLAGIPIAIERDSHKRIQNARDRIQSNLVIPAIQTATSPADKMGKLLQLKSCLTEDCYVLHIVSDNRREAYQLFSVLNDRGRTLSDGDLLRSHTLELLEDHSTLQDQTERNWDFILATSQSEIDQFLRSYYPSFVGQRAPKRSFFDNFRNQFFNYQTLPLSDSEANHVERTVANMKVESDTFTALTLGEWPYSEPEVSAWDRDRLHRLINTLGHDLSIPLLLSAYRNLDEQAFSTLVNFLERFVFRYIVVVRARPSQLASRYYRHAVKIREEGSSYNLNVLKTDLRDLQQTNAGDHLFEAGLENRLTYGHSSQNRIIKHFLTMIEDHSVWFENGAPNEPKPDKMTSFDLEAPPVGYG